MKAKAEAMVLASFAGDSLALGPHWIYDIDEIERRVRETKAKFLDAQERGFKI